MPHTAVRQCVPLSSAETTQLKEEFESIIKKDTGIRPYPELTEDCWDFPFVNKSGQSVMQRVLPKKLGIVKGHRLSMFLYKNKEYIANETLWVLHSCDRMRCVNPSHLRMGTSDENITDRQTRGRTRGFAN